MKKFIYILLAVVLIFGGFTVFHYISIPEKTIVFDYDDNAYQLNTKNCYIKKSLLTGTIKLHKLRRQTTAFSVLQKIQTVSFL